MTLSFLLQTPSTGFTSHEAYKLQTKTSNSDKAVKRVKISKAHNRRVQGCYKKQTRASNRCRKDIYTYQAKQKKETKKVADS